MEPSEQPSAVRRILVLALKIIVSAGLLALLISQVDPARFWAYARTASPGWLALSLALYGIVVAVSTWRWRLLLTAQGVDVPGSMLFGSYLVAGFFNNFLPSNIGGDVIRIKDTAAPAGSKTLATTVVLTDRGIGLIGLFFVAAIGASATAEMGGRAAAAALPVLPWMLWAVLATAAGVSAPAILAPEGVGRLLQPLRVFHREWVEERILRITDALARFRKRPRSLVGCFSGGVVVQTLLVLFYVAIARSMHIPVSAWQLAVIVPISFVVQMLPVSVNGFGVREATFTFCFARLGLPLESALVVSFVGAALVMVFSLTGVPVYLARRA